MCKWGESVELEVTVPAHLSHTGEAYRKRVGIDACIAPLVAALNQSGIVTEGSCCGHGRTPPTVQLAHGVHLVLMPKEQYESFAAHAYETKSEPPEVSDDG